jgi:Ca2+-binding EF-hand superfamily protein
MKRAVFICGVTLSAIAITSVAAFAAADHRGGQRMSFEEIDVDADGTITLLEMQGVAAARFATVDSDGDGYLTQTELENAAQMRAQRHAERMIDHLDTDGDGKIALAEMKPRRDPARMFDRIDADDDGAISEAEFDAAQEKRKGKGRHSHN